MSVVEEQMIAQHDQSDNNHIVISTQVNANETTNTVKTIPLTYSSNCKTKTANCLAYHNVDANSEVHENSYYTFSETNTKSTVCVNRALKIIFSPPGLVVLVVGYSVMGALIFPLLEVPQNMRQSMEIAKSREDCLRELWAITEKLNVLYERNWTILVHEQLRQFEGSIVSATRKVAMDNNFITNTRGGALIRANMNTEQMGWTFSEALLYSLTVITTIGHGSLTPKTPAGKIATIFYALIGVPLMLMCLSSLGIFLADALQCTYAKLCCQLTRQHGNVSSPDETNDSSRKLEEDKYQRHCSLNDQLAATTSCQKLENKSIANTGCNGCKYDGILNAVNSHNDCKFCGHDVFLDASHSKQNAMQYKLYCNSTTNKAVVTGTAAETVAQTKPANVLYQQQQQQQQQKPMEMEADIMLMPMTTNIEKPTTTAEAAEATATTHIKTYAFSNVGEGMLNSTSNSLPQPSLPLYFQHPVQTIRIAVSQANPVNGNNTSTMPRFFIRRLEHHHQQQQQQQPPQHLVATTNNCRFMLPAPPTISHSPYSHNGNGKWANVTTQPTKIYFPITATSTLPRQSSYTQTFNRYEHILPQSKAIDHQLQDMPFPIATNSPIGMRRAQVLTNPLSPELTSLRSKTCVINKNLNDINSIHNNKYNHEMTTLPVQHSVDCKATAIMEDEEENEQRRLGNCPHGTPSRVPLIEGPSDKFDSKRAANELRLKNSTIKSKRCLKGVKFHRHSNDNFQNSAIYLKSEQCEAHNPIKRHRQRRRSYCGNGIECSDDDEVDAGDVEYDDDDECVHNSGCYVRKRPDDRPSAKEEQFNNDDDEEQPVIPNSPQIPISIVLILLTCYICLGAGIFSFWENWSLIDGAYFCFVTLTTIGYGDFVPEHVLSSAGIHFFTFCAYLLIGLILVAMSLSIFETQLLWKCRRIAVRLKLVD